MTKTSKRCFLAIDCAPAFAKEVTRMREYLAPVSAKVSWVKPHALHVTTHFFSALEPPAVESVVALTQAATQQTPPFQMNMSSVGVFPNKKHPRVVWIGFEGDCASLQALKKTIDEGLAKHGFPIDQRLFLPHLTVCRVKQFNGDTAFSHNISTYCITYNDVCTVNEFVFYESKLTSTGPCYSRIAVFPLTG